MITDLKDAITHARETAERLREKAPYIDDSKYANVSAKADCLECAREHDQLADWLEELKERREADKWIPVSEKLPEYSDNYLVFVDDGYIDIGVYHSDKEEWSLCDAHGFYWTKDKRVGIIAWKPLPKPYESEEK